MRAAFVAAFALRERMQAGQLYYTSGAPRWGMQTMEQGMQAV